MTYWYSRHRQDCKNRWTCLRTRYCRDRVEYKFRSFRLPLRKSRKCCANLSPECWSTGGWWRITIGDLAGLWLLARGRRRHLLKFWMKGITIITISIFYFLNRCHYHYLAEESRPMARIDRDSLVALLPDNQNRRSTERRLSNIDTVLIKWTRNKTTASF